MGKATLEDRTQPLLFRLKRAVCRTAALVLNVNVRRTNDVVFNFKIRELAAVCNSEDGTRNKRGNMLDLYAPHGGRGHEQLHEQT